MPWTAETVNAWQCRIEAKQIARQWKYLRAAVAVGAKRPLFLVQAVHMVTWLSFFLKGADPMSIHVV